MKRTLIVLLALAVLCLVAGIGLAAVANTPHDIRNGSADQICAFCHTPHQGSSSGYPLWNRTQTAPTYTMYTSATFDMGPAAATPGFPSAACLTCHNGVASTLVNYPGPGSLGDTNYNFTMGNATNYAIWANVGADLRNDHPVSFTYNPAQDNQANGFPNASGGRILNLYQLYGSAVPGNQMECATCHAVHDTATYTKNPWSVTSKTHTGTTGEVYFLRTTNVASRMCNDCHVNR